jgi:uncharacterized coiled-coil protein SlyX
VSDPLFEEAVHTILRKRNGMIFRVLGFTTVLAVVAVAAAYISLNYARVAETAPAAPPASMPSPGGSPDAVPLQDIMSLQEQMAESLEATRRDLVTQQSDLKKLSDQVSALAAKIDGLQNSARPPAPPDPVRPAAITAQRTATAQRPPKPTGAISVGGVPLPVVPQLEDR